MQESSNKTSNISSNTKRLEDWKTGRYKPLDLLDIFHSHPFHWSASPAPMGLTERANDLLVERGVANDAGVRAASFSSNFSYILTWPSPLSQK